MHAKEPDFSHSSPQPVPRRMRQNRPRRRRQRRRWPFLLLLVALLILALAFAHYAIETSSDQLYVGPENRVFLQLVIGPDKMVPTIELVQLTIFNNNGLIVKKATCYADVGSQPTFTYERQNVSWLGSLFGLSTGIKLLQVDGCAPQLNCLLHTNAVCITPISKEQRPENLVRTEPLPFTIPPTGTRKVTYTIVTTQDGIAVSASP